MSEFILPTYDECQQAILANEAGAIEIFIYEYEPVIGDTEFREKLRYALLHHAAELQKLCELLEEQLTDVRHFNKKLQAENDERLELLARMTERAARFEAESVRLKRVANVASDIFKVADIKCNCPHGNSGRYPTHAWWCDDCFGELEQALQALKAGE